MKFRLASKKIGRKSTVQVAAENFFVKRGVVGGTLILQDRGNVISEIKEKIGVFFLKKFSQLGIREQANGLAICLFL